MVELRANGTYIGPPYTPIPLSITDGVTDVLFCPWCSDLFVQITTDGLGSGDSLEATVEGSLDNSGWDNLNTSDTATTLSTDGTVLLSFTGALPPYIRVSVSTVVDVAPTATVLIKAYVRVIS